jgi:hydrogenase 3 maturation protease
MSSDLGRLAEHLVGRVCVVGIGNRLAGDDGAGSAVAERLAGRVEGRVIDAGIAPENHLEPALRDEPDTILLIDAVDFGEEPGSVRVLDAGTLATGGISTHATSLGMIHDYLRARSPARAVLVGIQPGELRLGAALSDRVARSVETIARRIAELMGSRPAG